MGGAGGGDDIVSMISKALVDSPIVRFTPEERSYKGDGVPRDFGGRPLGWYMKMMQDAERGDKWGE